MLADGISPPMHLLARNIVACVLALTVGAGEGFAQAAPPRTAAPRLELALTDENGVAVPSARVVISTPAGQQVALAETNFAGRVTVGGLQPGHYRLAVEKAGFYNFSQEMDLAPGTALDVSITHQQPV